MQPRALSGRALNRALMAGQSLLAPAGVTVPAALEGMGGLRQTSSSC